MVTKSELRNAVRVLKRRFSPAELARRSVAPVARVEALPEFKQATTVAAYWPLPDEVDVRELVSTWCGAKRFFLPAMRGEELELREYTAGCALDTAAFGVCEPAGEAFPPEQIDLILVPGMAFDRRGRRLGRGKGFYDRLLARTPAVKVGVCFDFQLLDEIPVEPHDVAMDVVVTG